MTPGKFDLDLYHGDSYAWRFVLWDDVNRTVPTNLSSATVAAEFRDKPGGEIIMEFVCVILLPNTIDMSLPASLWVDASKSGIWDLELTFSDGRVRTPVAGKVTVTSDVTNSGLVP